MFIVIVSVLLLDLLAVSFYCFYIVLYCLYFILYISFLHLNSILIANILYFNINLVYRNEILLNMFLDIFTYFKLYSLVLFAPV